MIIIDGRQVDFKLSSFDNLQEVIVKVMEDGLLEERVVTDVLVDNEQFSEIYPHQAFQIGKNILALQFHIEVAADSLEKWLIGHTCELQKAKINIPQLRQHNQKYAPDLENQAAIILKQYLQQIGTVASS